MDKYLYRYISFDLLVDLVQRQALTLVLPEMWDDPYEAQSIEQLVSQSDNVYEQIALYVVYLKTYAQSWSKLSESDAMWRIYSYGNKAIRIKVKESNINLLKDTKIIEVKYTNNLQSPLPSGEHGLLEAFSRKRKAFSHEKEVRIIKYHKFQSDEEFKKNIESFLSISEHPQSLQILNNLFPNMPIEEQVERALKNLNLAKSSPNTTYVSFKDIPNFIDGVLVHPLAPEYYVEIVKEFCKNNSIKFEGKSKLYSK